MRPLKLSIMASTGLSLAMLSTVANAQTSDEIVTTGIRQAYQGDFTPLETPQAELDISAQILKDVNVTDLNGALDLSASVTRQNNFGGLWNAFAIRGFVGDENLPSNYLVNGFNAGRGFAGPRDIAGIETVQILKGPRAAVFGRGEPGGTVNLITKRPTFETGGEVKFTAGSFDTYRGEADLDYVASDSIGIRLTGFYEDAESFRDTIETERLGFYPSIAFRPTDRTQLVYELELTEQKIPFDRGVVAVNNELGVIPIETFLGEPSNGPMQGDVLGHQIELQHEFSDNWSALVGLNYRDTSLKGLDTAATLSGSRQFLLRDGANLSRERRSREYDAQYFVARGEVSGEFQTGSLTHRILIGSDYDTFENDQVFMRARGGGIQAGESPLDPVVAERLQIINIFNPTYGQFDLPTPSSQTDRVETQKSFGVFIQDQIALTDRLDVRVGLRFDDYNQELENRLAGTISESSETQISPQFGALYKINDTVSIYGAYGKNFRPLSGVDPEGNGFDPNNTTSIEGGLKFALMEGALQGTATVFQIEQENILAVTDGFAALAVGEAGSKGFELDVSGHITESFSVWSSYSYVDAQTDNTFNDPNFGASVPAGTRLLNVPKHQFSLQVSNDFKAQGVPLRIGGGMLYVGKRLGQFGDVFAQGIGEFELPAYTNMRVFAEYDVTEAVRLRVDVDNLTNEDIYLNSFSSLWVQPGAPRNWRASVAYKF